MADSAGKIIALVQAMTPKVKVDPAVIEQAVSDWLDDHPEATTTVDDGSITFEKLNASLQVVAIQQILNGWDTVNWETGYLNSEGTVTANGSFRHTDYIPVSEGDTISYKLSGYSTTVYIVVGYDSSKAKVTGADVVGVTGWTEGTYTVPSGVSFVRLCSGNPTTCYFNSETVYGTKLKATKAYIDEKDGVLSDRITANETELAELDGLESVKDFYTMSPNLIDPSKIALYSGSLYRTEFIEVTPGERYTCWTNNVIYTYTWYDSSKTQIEEVLLNNSGFEKIAPNTAAYIRVIYKVEDGTVIMLAKGIVGKYVPYGVMIPITDLPIYIVRDSNNINNSHIFAQGLNVSSSGVIGANVGCSVTDFIPVEEGETYYIGGEGDKSVNVTGTAAYNSSKEFVETFSSPYTVSDGVAYIRIGYTTPDNTGVYTFPCVRKGAADSGLQNFNPYDTFQIVNTKPTAYEQANSLYGLKWNVMGDSITEGSGSTKTYAAFIKERTGVIPHGYGVSNTAIARRGEAYTNDMCMRYSSMTDDADIITVFGGTNDQGNNIPIGEWGDDSEYTLYGAMKILCEGLIDKYMGKRIGFITPLPKYVGSTDYSYPSEAFKPYIDCIKDVCARYSIPVLDLWTESGIAPSMSTVRTAMIPDGLHPNATGHEVISWKIQRFLERL